MSWEGACTYAWVKKTEVCILYSISFLKHDLCIHPLNCNCSKIWPKTFVIYYLTKYIKINQKGNQRENKPTIKLRIKTVESACFMHSYGFILSFVSINHLVKEYRNLSVIILTWSQKMKTFQGYQPESSTT